MKPSNNHSTFGQLMKKPATQPLRQPAQKPMPSTAPRNKTAVAKRFGKY